MNGGLRQSRLRRPRNSEEINPLDGAINIVDAMLVFACGMMLSLIIHWNVDLGQAGTHVEVNRDQEVTQTPEIQKDLIQGQGQLYEEMGKVYKDPTTGKLFMLTK
ncbi:MAG TPA: DUF2149 domain-containing protein [Desulfosporosinus sp.]|nr:DUF2149 domain-containing protein [Desulfosporosinus sp.]